MLLEKSVVCGQRLTDKWEKYLFTVSDLQQTYSQWYQMVGLDFCKHTSSRTKKAWLIDHGSWSHKPSKAVPAQHHWHTVPIRKAVKFLGSLGSIWIHWEAHTKKKGNWVILNISGNTEKILFNFPCLCWIIHLTWMDSPPFNSALSLSWRTQGYRTKEGCSWELRFTQSGFIVW